MDMKLPFQLPVWMLHLDDSIGLRGFILVPIESHAKVRYDRG